MSTKNNRVILTVMILLALVACMAGLFVSQHLAKKKVIDISSLNGTLLDKPRKVKPFKLVGVDHQAFTNANLKGQWTMMFFGFTQCGSLCPTTMAELAKMYRLLESQKVTPLPRVMMISIDPEHDNVNKLASYVHAFDSHFYGARGSDHAVKSMTNEFGIAYFKVSSTSKARLPGDAIEHTGTVMLFNPQGELIAFFTTPHRANNLAHDYRLITSI